MSAALYMSRRGHKVTLVEKDKRLGGQFNLAWRAPGKERMEETLSSYGRMLETEKINIVNGKELDAAFVREIGPDLLVWAVGAIQNIPEVPGLKDVYSMTSIEYFQGAKKVQGPRVLVIGAGRIGVEIAEKLGQEGFDVVATKRTDPIGSAMEPITRALALKRIDGMKSVAFMPHTAVKGFHKDRVVVEKDGEGVVLAPFQTVILTSGMLPAPAPGAEIARLIPRIETIGDAKQVMDILSAVEAGYRLAASC